MNGASQQKLNRDQKVDYIIIKANREKRKGYGINQIRIANKTAADRRQ